MNSLRTICHTEDLILALEVRDELLARVRVPWGNGWRSFTWLMVENVNARPNTWIAHLETAEVQREIAAILRARAERDRKGLSGEEHNVTWRWISDEMRAVRKQRLS